MAEVSVAIADDNRQTLNLLGEILEKEDGIHVVGVSYRITCNNGNQRTLINP